MSLLFKTINESEIETTLNQQQIDPNIVAQQEKLLQDPNQTNNEGNRMFPENKSIANNELRIRSIFDTVAGSLTENFLTGVVTINDKDKVTIEAGNVMKTFGGLFGGAKSWLKESSKAIQSSFKYGFRTFDNIIVDPKTGEKQEGVNVKAGLSNFLEEAWNFKQQIESKKGSLTPKEFRQFIQQRLAKTNPIMRDQLTMTLTQTSSLNREWGDKNYEMGIIDTIAKSFEAIFIYANEQKTLFDSPEVAKQEFENFFGSYNTLLENSKKDRYLKTDIRSNAHIIKFIVTRFPSWTVQQIMNVFPQLGSYGSQFLGGLGIALQATAGLQMADMSQSLEARTAKLLNELNKTDLPAVDKLKIVLIGTQKMIASADEKSKGKFENVLKFFSLNTLNVDTKSVGGLLNNLGDGTSGTIVTATGLNTTINVIKNLYNQAKAGGETVDPGLQANIDILQQVTLTNQESEQRSIVNEYVNEPNPNGIKSKIGQFFGKKAEDVKNYFAKSEVVRDAKKLANGVGSLVQKGQELVGKTLDYYNNNSELVNLAKQAGNGVASKMNQVASITSKALVEHLEKGGAGRSLLNYFDSDRYKNQELLTQILASVRSKDGATNQSNLLTLRDNLVLKLELKKNASVLDIQNTLYQKTLQARGDETQKTGTQILLNLAKEYLGNEQITAILLDTLNKASFNNLDRHKAIAISLGVIGLQSATFGLGFRGLDMNKELTQMIAELSAGGGLEGTVAGGKIASYELENSSNLAESMARVAYTESGARGTIESVTSNARGLYFNFTNSSKSIEFKTLEVEPGLEPTQIKIGNRTGSMILYGKGGKDVQGSTSGHTFGDDIKVGDRIQVQIGDKLVKVAIDVVNKDTVNFSIEGGANSELGNLASFNGNRFIANNFKDGTVVESKIGNGKVLGSYANSEKNGIEAAVIRYNLSQIQEAGYKVEMKKENGITYAEISDNNGILIVGPGASGGDFNLDVNGTKFASPIQAGRIVVDGNNPSSIDLVVGNTSIKSLEGNGFKAFASSEVPTPDTTQAAIQPLPSVPLPQVEPLLSSPAPEPASVEGQQSQTANDTLDNQASPKIASAHTSEPVTQSPLKYASAVDDPKFNDHLKPVEPTTKIASARVITEAPARVDRLPVATLPVVPIIPQNQPTAPLVTSYTEATLFNKQGQPVAVDLGAIPKNTVVIQSNRLVIVNNQGEVVPVTSKTPGLSLQERSNAKLLEARLIQNPAPTPVNSNISGDGRGIPMDNIPDNANRLLQIRQLNREAAQLKRIDSQLTPTQNARLQVINNQIQALQNEIKPGVVVPVAAERNSDIPDRFKPITLSNKITTGNVNPLIKVDINKETILVLPGASEKSKTMITINGKTETLVFAKSDDGKSYKALIKSDDGNYYTLDLKNELVQKALSSDPLSKKLFTSFNPDTDIPRKAGETRTTENTVYYNPNLPKNILDIRKLNQSIQLGNGKNLNSFLFNSEIPVIIGDETKKLFKAFNIETKSLDGFIDGGKNLEAKVENLILTKASSGNLTTEEKAALTRYALVVKAINQQQITNNEKGIVGNRLASYSSSLYTRGLDNLTTDQRQFITAGQRLMNMLDSEGRLTPNSVRGGDHIGRGSSESDLLRQNAALLSSVKGLTMAIDDKGNYVNASAFGSKDWSGLVNKNGIPYAFEGVLSKLDNNQVAFIVEQAKLAREGKGYFGMTDGTIATIQNEYAKFGKPIPTRDQILVAAVVGSIPDFLGQAGTIKGLSDINDVKNFEGFKGYLLADVFAGQRDREQNSASFLNNLLNKHINESVNGTYADQQNSISMMPTFNQRRLDSSEAIASAGISVLTSGNFMIGLDITSTQSSVAGFGDPKSLEIGSYNVSEDKKGLVTVKYQLPSSGGGTPLTGAEMAYLVQGITGNLGFGMGFSGSTEVTGSATPVEVKIVFENTKGAQQNLQSFLRLSEEVIKSKEFDRDDSSIATYQKLLIAKATELRSQGTLSEKEYQISVALASRADVQEALFARNGNIAGAGEYGELAALKDFTNRRGLSISMNKFSSVETTSGYTIGDLANMEGGTQRETFSNLFKATVTVKENLDSPSANLIFKGMQKAGVENTSFDPKSVTLPQGYKMATKSQEELINAGYFPVVTKADGSKYISYTTTMADGKVEARLVPIDNQFSWHVVIDEKDKIIASVRNTNTCEGNFDIPVKGLEPQLQIQSNADCIERGICEVGQYEQLKAQFEIDNNRKRQIQNVQAQSIKQNGNLFTGPLLQLTQATYRAAETNNMIVIELNKLVTQYSTGNPANLDAAIAKFQADTNITVTKEFIERYLEAGGVESDKVTDAKVNQYYSNTFGLSIGVGIFGIGFKFANEQTIESVVKGELQIMGLTVNKNGDPCILLNLTSIGQERFNNQQEITLAMVSKPITPNPTTDKTTTTETKNKPAMEPQANTVANPTAQPMPTNQVQPSTPTTIPPAQNAPVLSNPPAPASNPLAPTTPTQTILLAPTGSVTPITISNPSSIPASTTGRFIPQTIFTPPPNISVPRVAPPISPSTPFSSIRR